MMSEILSHPIPAMVGLLGVLIFIHELGHFVAGRLSGIAVEAFSIGFGPPILRFKRKGTDFQVSLLPIGGYVKFAGHHPLEDIPEGLDGIAYREAKLWQRAVAIAAGPLANVFLAVVVYIGMGMVGIEHMPASIGGVIPDSAAESAGLEYNDIIKSIDGKKILTWTDMVKVISKSPGKNLDLVVERAEKEIQIQLVPEEVDGQDMVGRKQKIGRAGVMLGRISAIVTVSDPTTPAAKAGLTTGDRILSVIISGEEKKVPFWPDFLRILENNEFKDGVQLKLTKAPLPGEQAVINPEIRTATIAFDENTFANLTSGREKAKFLGIHDSQLTFGKSTDQNFSQIFKAGDHFIKWQGTEIQNIFHLLEMQSERNDKTVEITIVRDGTPIALTVDLKPVDTQALEGRVTIYQLPILFWGQLEDPEQVIEIYSNPLSAMMYAIKRAGNESLGIAGSLVELITGSIPLQALGGPILIASVASESAKRGWNTYLKAMAIISINLAVINLFPIPALDGGQLVLLGAEAIRRKPLGVNAIENFQRLGFAMIMALVVLATYNDFRRFWKSMLESLIGTVQ